jgi:hypothetical protein
VTPDAASDRLACEQKLMGRTTPLWVLEGDSTVKLTLDDDGWKAFIGGRGKGRLKACFADGRTCSKELGIDK